LLDGARDAEGWTEDRVPRFVSVGEVIVELFGDKAGGYRFSVQGAASDTARGVRTQIGADWKVGLFTALGDDIYSQLVVDDLATSGIEIGHVLKIGGRSIGLSLVEATRDGPRVTNWRSVSAARVMADDPAAMAAAFDGAKAIHVSGGAFAILQPRARGRLLKALHVARQAGAWIVLAPHEWPDMWTSRRVMGSAINAAAMVADAVFTVSPGETATYGEARAEAVATRYHDWGVAEVLVDTQGDRLYFSTPAGGRWLEVGKGESAAATVAYLASRLQGAPPDAAAAAVSRK
jgi:2-dehydro-3-deoxygluconokinase